MQNDLQSISSDSKLHDHKWRQLLMSSLFWNNQVDQEDDPEEKIKLILETIMLIEPNNSEPKMKLFPRPETIKLIPKGNLTNIDQ